jgi:hypothetical protein
LIAGVVLFLVNLVGGYIGGKLGSLLRALII